MSGIAYAASTMPGSVATFRSWSSEWSIRIAARISSSAKTRAGTRIAPSCGSSQSVSSRREGSDVENDVCTPSPFLVLERQAVVGRRLHERVDRADGAVEPRVERCIGEPHGSGARNESLRVGEVDQLLEPVDEE